jgi:hypothetical protein
MSGVDSQIQVLYESRGLKTVEKCSGEIPIIDNEKKKRAWPTDVETLQALT